MTKYWLRRIAGIFFAAVALPLLGQTLKIDVVLPFTEGGEAGAQSVEFYRGLLMAADVMRAQGKDLCIHAYNEEPAPIGIAATLKKVEADAPHVLIGPLHAEHWAYASAFATSEGIHTVIPFASEVPVLSTNPYIVTLDAPEALKAVMAAALLRRAYPKGKLIYVRPVKGEAESVFASRLKSELRQQGYEVGELEAGFSDEKFCKALSKTQQNLVMAASSSLSELQNLASRVHTYRVSLPEYALSLVAQPVHVAHQTALSKMLHDANALLPTPSFYNPQSADVHNVEANYTYYFMQAPAERVPRLYLLGYDFGLYVLSGLAYHGATFWGQSVAVPQYQTTFKFQRPADGQGFTNMNIRLYHFKDNGGIDMIE